MCREVYDAEVLTIHSKEQQEFISHLAFVKHDLSFHVWLGAIRESNTTGFRWLNYAPFNYTSWDPHSLIFKNNDNLQHCLVMSFATDGNWWDYWCSSWCYAICQKSLQSFQDKKGVSSQTYAVPEMKRNGTKGEKGINRNEATNNDVETLAKTSAEAKKLNNEAKDGTQIKANASGDEIKSEKQIAHNGVPGWAYFGLGIVTPFAVLLCVIAVLFALGKRAGRPLLIEVPYSLSGSNA